MNYKKSNFLSLLFLLISISITAKTSIVTLFSHGIADTLKQALWYAKTPSFDTYNDLYLFTTPFFSFNYPDAKHYYYETSFGGENEISRLHSAYQKMIRKAFKKWNTVCDIILFGLSRGASNLLIFAGTYKISNVKAIIVESPYYTMSDVIQHLMHKLHCGFLPLSYGEYLAECIFRRYKHDGICPRDCLENIPKDIPILIICSQEDSLVPYTTSIDVYKKLIAAGHKNTFIFITDHGRHAKILSGEDGEKYQAVVHAFYKYHNLPHDPSVAAKGNSMFALCQPIL